jgi:hypothetical protein
LKVLAPAILEFTRFLFSKLGFSTLFFGESNPGVLALLSTDLGVLIMDLLWLLTILGKTGNTMK